jgi:hypothetical protein
MSPRALPHCLFIEYPAKFFSYALEFEAFDEPITKKKPEPRRQENLKMSKDDEYDYLFKGLLALVCCVLDLLLRTRVCCSCADWRFWCRKVQPFVALHKK